MMKKKRIALLLLLCVCAASLTWVYSQNASLPLVNRVIAFVMSISLDQAQNANLPPANQIVELSEDQFAEITANQQKYETLRMQPTVDRVARLGSETLDESFLKLGIYDDGQYFRPGYMTNVWGESTKMQTLFSNRRVIKVLQEFEKLPRTQAEAKAKEFHHFALNALSRVIDDELPLYAGIPQDAIWGVVNKDEQYMALTSLLLSASLGDTAFLLERIEEWEQLVVNVKETILSQPETYPSGFAEFYPQFYFPDATCFVSIVMFATERNGSLMQNAGDYVADCRVMDIPIAGWNANKTYFDELRHGGTPASEEDTRSDFRIYRLRHGSEKDDRYNEELVQALKRAVMNAN